MGVSMESSMLHIENDVQRNAEQEPRTEASHAMLVQLLHQHARSFVLTTPQLAEILGKSESALRLAESRHRSKFGTDLLPQPLLQNAEGRVWSIVQIASWLAQGGQTKATPSASVDKPTTRVGRPRKTVGSFTQQQQVA